MRERVELLGRGEINRQVPARRTGQGRRQEEPVKNEAIAAQSACPKKSKDRQKTMFKGEGRRQEGNSRQWTGPTVTSGLEVERGLSGHR